MFETDLAGAHGKGDSLMEIEVYLEIQTLKIQDLLVVLIMVNG